MGIRVNKVLGYGITDIKLDKNENIIDERTNQDILYGIDNYFYIEDFIDYVKEQDNNKISKTLLISNINSLKGNEKIEDNLFNLITYDYEYGSDKTLLITPISCLHWSRRDDTIDYHEETVLYNQRTSIVELKNGIFPWTGSYISRKTGERFTNTGNVPKYSIAHQFMITEPEKDELRLEYAKSLNYKSIDEAEDDIGIFIPDEVRLFCEFTKLFTDNKYINYLKPLLYVYWS
jgi:hypothetical protein